MEDHTPAEEQDGDQRDHEGAHQESIPTLSSTRCSHQFPASTAAVPTPLLWSIDSHIKNAEEINTWHHNNWMLFNFLFLSTTGAAAKFLLQHNPKPGEFSTGKAAWSGMILIAKYQNSTPRRKRIMINQLASIVMAEGQDPDVFIYEICNLRDELVGMIEVINDDSLDIVPEGLTDDYDQTEYSAEANDKITPDNVMYAIRNMHAHRIAKTGLREN